MEPNLGLWLCRGATFVGAILAAAGIFWAPHFTAKIDAEKNVKIDKLVKGNSTLMAKNEELVVGNTQLMNKNQELISKVDTYRSDLEIKNERIQELEKGQNVLQERTQATSFIISDVQKIALNNGQYKITFLLIPQGHNVIPIFDVDVKTNDGTKIISLDIECRTRPPMSEQYPAEPTTHRRVIFRNVIAEPIKLIAITDRDTILDLYSRLEIKKQ